MNNKYGNLLDKAMNRENNNANMENKYGNLLNKAMNRENDYEEASNDRYGGLLDKAKPDLTLYDDMLKVENTSRQLRQRKDDEYQQINLRIQERIEREKREEQERLERNNAFINSYLDKKKAEREAAEEKRREAEREKNFVNNIQRLIDIGDGVSGKIAQTNAMLKKEEERQKEYEEKMAWYKGQQKVL